MTKKIIKSLAVLATLVTVTAFVAGMLAVRQMSLPPGGAGEVIIVIEQGWNLNKTARSLEDAEVIRSARYFRWITDRKGMAGNIRAGEYSISKNITPAEVLDILVQGRVVFRRFTVPEGKTLAEIALIVEKTGIADAQKFIAAASNIAGMEAWVAPGIENLEGLLFPETYTYTRQTTAEKTVQMMTGRFRSVFEPLWNKRDANLGLKPYEVVILASMIEKETGLAAERPLIAGVFLNRLKKNMRLMCDPTVIYGIPNFNGNLTRKDLERPTPYNTYTQQGLPAGPICNPGADSLKAVFHPAGTQALYFVAKGDGSHKFSNTLEEHNQAVNLYQKGK